MNSKKMNLTESDLPKACNYIAQQFAAHSWWPTEQPGEAKREFELMKSSATALNAWCERWLDAGQCKKWKKSFDPSRIGRATAFSCPTLLTRTMQNAAQYN